eukprot:701525-Prorocentrum_minimum.AAC.1
MSNSLGGRNGHAYRNLGLVGTRGVPQGLQLLSVGRFTDHPPERAGVSGLVGFQGSLPIRLVQHQPAELIDHEGLGLLQVVQKAPGRRRQQHDALPQARLFVRAVLPAVHGARHEPMVALHQRGGGLQHLRGGARVVGSERADRSKKIHKESSRALC